MYIYIMYTLYFWKNYKCHWKVFLSSRTILYFIMLIIIIFVSIFSVRVFLYFGSNLTCFFCYYLVLLLFYVPKLNLKSTTHWPFRSWLPAHGWWLCAKWQVTTWSLISNCDFRQTVEWLQHILFLLLNRSPKRSANTIIAAVGGVIIFCMKTIQAILSEILMYW